MNLEIKLGPIQVLGIWSGILDAFYHHQPNFVILLVVMVLFIDKCTLFFNMLQQ